MLPPGESHWVRAACLIKVRKNTRRVLLTLTKIDETDRRTPDWNITLSTRHGQHNKYTLCICLVDDKRVVGRSLHALLYTMLIHYRLAEAVRLVELVLRLHDVRQLAAVYKMSESSVADLLSSYAEVWVAHVNTVERLHQVDCLIQTSSPRESEAYVFTGIGMCVSVCVSVWRKPVDGKPSPKGTWLGHVKSWTIKDFGGYQLYLLNGWSS